MNHTLLLYENHKDQFNAAADFIRSGLVRDELCIYLFNENRQEDVLRELEKRGVNVESALQAKSLIVMPAEKVYLESGDFRPEKIKKSFDDILYAQNRKYTSYRLTGEMTWALGKTEALHMLPNFESVANNFEEPLGLCQYNVKKFSPEIIKSVMPSHPQIIYKDAAYDNFFYTPPEEFLKTVSEVKTAPTKKYVQSRGHAVSDSFFKQYPLITYERGERIIRPNELDRNVVRIESGFLKIYKATENGKEIIINIVNSATYDALTFGIATYIQDYSIQALSGVKVRRAPKEDFVQYLKQRPEEYIKLLEPLNQCLASVYSQLEWLKSGDAYSKIASVIHYLGKETGSMHHNTLTVGFHVTHQLIANLTGITRETVTIQLNRLRKKGFITYDNNVLSISDVRGLLADIEFKD